MKNLTSKELRALYLQFFRERGHAVIPSASLIPENDPTVLFTTAGMHPLVPYLMGQTHPAGKRLLSSPHRHESPFGILLLLFYIA